MSHGPQKGFQKEATEEAQGASTGAQPAPARTQVPFPLLGQARTGWLAVIPLSQEPL